MRRLSLQNLLLLFIGGYLIVNFASSFFATAATQQPQNSWYKWSFKGDSHDGHDHGPLEKHDPQKMEELQATIDALIAEVQEMKRSEKLIIRPKGGILLFGCALANNHCSHMM
jgi:hypothetical protein